MQAYQQLAATVLSDGVTARAAVFTVIFKIVASVHLQSEHCHGSDRDILYLMEFANLILEMTALADRLRVEE
jgi:hypothetical protein